MDAIKRVYQSELLALGDMAEHVAVEVGEDKIHGSLAVITIKVAATASLNEVKTKADELLGVYTVRYKLKMTS